LFDNSEDSVLTHLELLHVVLRALIIHYINVPEGALHCSHEVTLVIFPYLDQVPANIWHLFKVDNLGLTRNLQICVGLFRVQHQL